MIPHSCRRGANGERREANEAKIARLIAAGGLSLSGFEEADARKAAGSARRAGATLVTANGRVFERVPALSVADRAR